MQGRTTGWSGQIDWPPDDAPAGGRHRAPRSAPPLVTEPEAEGLRKFDLGTVPASVTPPRTWRRAAWFAVASSGAVLSGLVLVTALVDSTPRPEHVDLPGMPRGEHLALLTPSSTAQPAPTDAAAPAGEPATGTQESIPGVPQPPGTAQQPTGDTPQAPEVSETAPPSTSTTAPSEQTPTSEAFELVAFADPEMVAERSEEYFGHISADDLRSAYELTTGPLREEGFEQFASRYAGVESVETLEVHTSSSRTVTTLRVVRADGSSETQRRELRFTTGDEPLVRFDQRVN